MSVALPSCDENITIVAAVNQVDIGCLYAHGNPLHLSVTPLNSPKEVDLQPAGPGAH